MAAKDCYQHGIGDKSDRQGAISGGPTKRIIDSSASGSSFKRTFGVEQLNLCGYAS
jgi:hypothetical protein